MLQQISDAVSANWVMAHFIVLPFLPASLYACVQLLKGQPKLVSRHICMGEVRESQHRSDMEQGHLGWSYWRCSIPQGQTVRIVHPVAPHYSRTQGIFLVNTLATLTQFHLCLYPLYLVFPSPPSSWCLTLTQKPPPCKSLFAARSAECCCLLCTQKFAEAVSCPQTSAPWSGAGEERQGLDWCACCSL